MPVTDTRTEDNPVLMGGGAEEDRLSAAHFLTGALFLVFGGLVYVLMIFSMRFGGISGVSYGRLEPIGVQSRSRWRRCQRTMATSNTE